jgi:hypothetical protein
LSSPLNRSSRAVTITGARSAVVDRHGNNAYGKAKVEERDRLIDKLKNMNICRGC